MLLIGSCPARAQTESDLVIEAIVESLADRVSEDFDFAELTERLNGYRQNPLNINIATSDDLDGLVFLSALQVSELIAYRKQDGDFIDLLELQSLETFDMATIKLLLPFVTLNEVSSAGKFRIKDLRNGKHDVMLRYGQVLERQKGYGATETPGGSRYLGSPQKLLVRYRYNADNRVMISFNMEKDAGEQFFAGGQPAGFDFYSGSVYLRSFGRMEKLVAGDFSLQFGQGLSLWSGLSFAKGADVAGAAKQDHGLKPYTSVNEALFFRGVAATLKFKQFRFTPFVSYRNVDASFEGETAISSLGVSGFHRTLTELGHKNAVSEFVAGSALQFDARALSVGFTGYQTVYEKPFYPGKFLYDQFEFSGRRLSNFAFNYSYNFRNAYFFGEAAHSINSGFAFINGAVASLSSKVSTVLLYRNYDRDYHSFFNQALSEATSAVNEKGFYAGLAVKPFRNWEMSAYADVFRFPWLKFGADAPSGGYELLSQITYTPNKLLKATGRYRREHKEENEDGEGVVRALHTVKKENYRLELTYKVSDAFSVRSRAEVSRYSKGTGSPEFG
ncbi:MAG TPA: helix-hairpin-helix domain-containing protein, partial [Sphingobacteriaceae bacterium]